MSDAVPTSVCGVGASAGGIEALQQFFGALPDDLGLAYVVILHLAPDRKSELPHILSRATTMPVAQVPDHEEVQLAPNHVYVIAPDRQLEMTDTAVSASPFDRARGRRSAIDLFFRSLAAAHGDGFAVVLSGSGSDGALGAKAIKESGGLILVQDPQEAAYGDMPRAVIYSGVADVVRPVRELATQLAELSRHRQGILPAVQAAEVPEPMREDEERALRGVLEVLRKRTGHDFSKYKRSTVLRRLLRRMQLAQQPTVQDYLPHLRANAIEVQALLNDLLISVTTFFRDHDAWDALQTKVIARLVEQDEQIRVWVPGCATGEEAYSLAMLFHEEFDRRNLRRNLLIFASDVDEAAIAVAREGVYPRAIAEDVADARLERFFRAEDDHYRVQSEVRDHLVFAVHSLMRDPPFSKLHLVSCRNLLIYLDRDLQEHVMAIFRYACRDDGYLFLGASEIASEDLFEAVDAKHRIFHIREDAGHDRPQLPAILAAMPSSRFRVEREREPVPRQSAAEMHVAALEEAAPPSVLVDDRWNVLHLSPTAARFLQQSGGPPARRLTDLVRPELRDDLHIALHRATERPEPQLSPFVQVTFNSGAPHRVAMLASQVPAKEGSGHRVLVTFLDGGAVVADGGGADQSPADATVRDLREKLRQSERRIETMRDDHFLTNEDLRAANEELQSLNEEYRSTTEELETSKEELQSINEELQTVNHELKLKLDEVEHTHTDLENFIRATDVAMLFLDRELRIKRFTPKVSEIFNVKPRDYGRPIGDLTHTLNYSAFQADAQQILRYPTAPIEREATSADGRALLVYLSAYQQPNGQGVDGVVITFVDVTELKHGEKALRDSELRLASEVEILRQLHRLTVEVTKVPTVQDALQYLLANAIELHRADFGDVQLWDATTRTLRVAAQQGLAPVFTGQVQSVDENAESACGRALRTRRTCQISDVDADPNAPSRAAAAARGYRSTQSTPLMGPRGEIVGVLSVHFKEPHVFTQRDNQVADLLGHQTANLIVMRMQRDELAQLNETLRKRMSELESSRQKHLRQSKPRASAPRRKA